MVMSQGPNNESVNLDVDNHGDGTFTCQYKHDIPGNYTVKVLYGDKNVPGSPFIIPVHSEAKPEQCYIEGETALHTLEHIIPYSSHIHTISISVYPATSWVLVLEKVL